MAVASVIIKCKACGKEFEYRKGCLNRKEAYSTEEWAKDNIDTCPECRKKIYTQEKKEEEERKYTEYSPLVEQYNLPILVGSENQVAWANRIRIIAIGEAIRNHHPNALFWEIISNLTDSTWWIEHRQDIEDTHSFYEELSKEHKKTQYKQEINDKIAALQKPSVPEVLNGHKWNQKIYGKAGNYSVYPDGEKVMITDDQAEEIREYVVAKEEYRKKVQEIKNA